MMIRKMLLAATALLVLAACSSSPDLGVGPSAAPSGSAVAGSDACHQDGQTYCVLNPAVTQATIGQTICVRGWTATVRPPVSVTEPIKKQDLAQYASQHVGDANWTLSGTELDHRVPLELGGSPADPNNLSPEEHVGSMGSVVKDADENAFNKSVCDGSQTLAAAQAAFVAKWLAPYPAYKDGKTSG